MKDMSVVQLPLFSESLLPAHKAGRSGPSASLHDYWQHPERLPPLIRQSPTVMRCLDLIGWLDWGDFPDRDLKLKRGQAAIPYAAVAAAELIKLNEGIASLQRLRRFLVEHPGFISLLGFAPRASAFCGLSFSRPAHLPTQRHPTKLLRQLPNSALQFLLADSVRLIGEALNARGIAWGECISLDTKPTAWRGVGERKQSQGLRDRAVQQGQTT